MSTHLFDYATFDLHIGEPTAAGYPVVVIQSPAGEGNSFCTLDPVTDLSNALGALAARESDAASLVELGAFLFDELLSGDVLELYRASLSLVRSQGKALRIRLRTAAAEMAALPWEFLYDSSERAFLAASSETALVRYIPLRLPARPTTIQGPLRLLAVIAAPNDLQPVDVERERAMLRSALAGAISQYPVDLQFVEHATVAAINAAMRSFRPHIFHFIGHAAHDGMHTVVMLEDEAQGAHAVDEVVFQEFFAGVQEARLAVLNACQSTALLSDKAFIGLAPRLLQRQLAAVVGMQHPISDAAALIFTREFYRSIALGYPIDAAISEARKGIYQELGQDAPDWGAPVLFLRAQDGQLFSRETGARQAPTLTPPPLPVRPPQVEGFIGRNAELDYFAEKLRSVNLAVITGMAGVGKTALAAMLAQQYSDPARVFWHSFHAGEGVDAIIWQLAAFLAHNGQDALWNLLESGRQTRSQPPPVETIFDYLLQMVRGRGFLLCFDDFHHVDQDPVLKQLVDRLRSALVAGDIAILITGRRMPEFVQIADFTPLAGLGREDVHRLLRLYMLDIMPEQEAQLHRHTGGNAQFLMLALAVLQQARDPAELIARLAETDDIARYLLREVDDTLNGGERAVMSAVAVFLGYPATRAAVEAVLDAGSVARILRILADRHLLLVQNGSAERQYLQHAMVQSFYYDAAGQRQRRGMHSRAGVFYADDEPDLLRSALHYQHAAEYSLAAQQATADVWALINQGQARALANLLKRFTVRQLPLEAWMKVGIARGVLHGFLGEREVAAASYADALSHIANTTKSPTLLGLHARACRGMAELLEDESPTDALEWLQRGLEAAPTDDGEERAALLIKTGLVQIYQGEDAAARQALEEGLRLQPAGPSRLRATALAQLGVVALNAGEMEQAAAYTEEALTLSETLQDHFQSALIVGNLGMIRHVAGDWNRGVSSFEDALIRFERLGNEKQQAYAALNLGAAYLYQGDFDGAEAQLMKCLALADRYHDRLTLLRAQWHRAELQMRRSRWDEAGEMLVQMEALANTLDDRGMVVWVAAARAEVTLAEGRPVDAEVFARRAVELAEQLDSDPDKAIGLRVLGRVLAHRQDFIHAQELFAASLSCLGDSDPYEVARTQVQWGLALCAGGDGAAGRAKLRAAQAVFARLGAGHDLAQVSVAVDGCVDKGGAE